MNDDLLILAGEDLSCAACLALCWQMQIILQVKFLLECTPVCPSFGYKVYEGAWKCRCSLWPAEALLYGKAGLSMILQSWLQLKLMCCSCHWRHGLLPGKHKMAPISLSLRFSLSLHQACLAIWQLGNRTRPFRQQVQNSPFSRNCSPPPPPPSPPPLLPSFPCVPLHSQIWLLFKLKKCNHCTQSGSVNATDLVGNITIPSAKLSWAETPDRSLPLH